MESNITDTPDKSYWTVYDYHMFERDAQAMRRAYIYASVGRLWRRIMTRIRTSAPPARQRERFDFARGL